MLLLALLWGAWGNVLAATMCPRMTQDHTCCRARVAHQHAAQHELADMQMGDMQMAHTETEPVAEQPPDANSFSQPVEPCEHCLSHSQGTTMPATLREAEQSKRSADVTPTLSHATTVTVPAPPARTITAREHAPPGAASSGRHVLISVFRI